MAVGVRSLAISCAFLGAFGFATAAKAAQEQDERLIYVMQFGGLTIADVMITLAETPDRYQSTIKMRSRGLLARFANLNADLVGEGKLIDGGLKVAPDSYRRDWSTETISSQLGVTYDPTTRVAVSTERLFNTVTGEEKRREDAPWNRRRVAPTPVPEDKRTQVVDPIAAFIGVRELIRSNAAMTTFKMPVYDGSRRYDIAGTIETPRDVTINDQSHKVITVKGRLNPVSGFDDRLQDRVHDGDGKILFSADGRLLPVQIMIGNSMGVGVMNLAADCRRDPAPCEAFGQETALAPKN